MNQQQYEVAIAAYGKYRHGDIIPEHAIRSGGGNPANLVERGVLKPTGKPVNCNVLPAPSPVSDGTPELIAERNELLEEVKKLRHEQALFEAKVKEQERLIAIRDQMLSEQTNMISHLQEACETHQAEIQRLTADMDALTAPEPAVA